MSYNPRTVALLAELLHPPMAPDPSLVQRVHNRMYEDGDPAYSSFSVTPAGAVLSNPVAQPGAASYAAFLPDRFQFREELTSLTPDDFARQVRVVSEMVVEARGIQVFTGQQVTVRTLVNPRHFKDSRTFLKNGMFGFGNQTQSFGREPQLFGIRLAFPAQEGEPSAYALRIESFSSDPRSLYIENQASFGPVLVERGLEVLERQVLEAYQFVLRNTLRFVNCFDSPSEQEQRQGGAQAE
ncbi:MAG: hypothetical protein IPJ19_07520 [Planctomycetes bacterium]|nr:hypothetical protein [Planctomycetota bacterium]